VRSWVPFPPLYWEFDRQRAEGFTCAIAQPFPSRSGLAGPRQAVTGVAQGRGASLRRGSANVPRAARRSGGVRTAR
jgi:hypothetical protein